jgi:hypothetical protein
LHSTNLRRIIQGQAFEKDMLMKNMFLPIVLQLALSGAPAALAQHHYSHHWGTVITGGTAVTALLGRL